MTRIYTEPQLDFCDVLFQPKRTTLNSRSDADVLRKTTVAPESRNLIRLSCDLQNETEREFIDALPARWILVK